MWLNRPFKSLHYSKFFSSRRRHTSLHGDWSSDVCSSDLTIRFVEVRIAIDARKLRDYGIGTYIRNLLRHLARIDDKTEYVVLCREEDRAFAAELGENFRAEIGRASCRERGYIAREEDSRA